MPTVSLVKGCHKWRSCYISEKPGVWSHSWETLVLTEMS